MRISCPHCGERDLREFAVKGAALERPEGDWGGDWDAYLHLRENPAGEAAEHWYHVPCGTWVVVTRHRGTHAVVSSALPGDGA